jgi:hypothetical protein
VAMVATDAGAVAADVGEMEAGLDLSKLPASGQTIPQGGTVLHMESAMTVATVSSTAAASREFADAAAAAIMFVIGETVALTITTVSDSEPVTAMEREGIRVTDTVEWARLQKGIEIGRGLLLGKKTGNLKRIIQMPMVRVCYKRSSCSCCGDGSTVGRSRGGGLRGVDSFDLLRSSGGNRLKWDGGISLGSGSCNRLGSGDDDQVGCVCGG